MNWRKQREAAAVSGAAAKRGATPLRRAGGSMCPCRAGRGAAVPGCAGSGAGGGRRDLQTYPHGGRGDGPPAVTAVAEAALAEFLRTVPVGRGQFGMNAFLDCYLDSMLTCGQAVGEIVPALGNRDIAALLCGRVEDIEIQEGISPLDFTLCGPDECGRMTELPCQELLLVYASESRGEQPLRRVAAAVTAVSDRHPDEDLPHRRRQLGAVRQRALRGDLPGRRRRSQRGGAEPDAGRGVVSGHAGDPSRAACRDFVAVGDVDIRGHRRRRADSGQ